ncbi:MAG: hypothetical protein ACLU18_07665 [Bacteroides thetaiotaomicron]
MNSYALLLLIHDKEGGFRPELDMAQLILRFDWLWDRLDMFEM